MKRKIIILGSVLLLFLLGYIVWAFPPLGNNFDWWDDPEIVCASVVKEDVELNFIKLEHRQKRIPWFGMLFSMTNHSQQDFLYNTSVYRVDYWHFGRWKTVNFCLFPQGPPEVCHAGETLESAIPFDEEVISYPGKYRAYLMDVGFVEFET